jgi:predicted GNAT family acetyltransferase
MNIQLEENGNKGAAFYENAAERLEEMTYSKAGDNLIIIDHTEVDESLQGQGVGRKLLDKIVEMLREKGIKAMPLCPFAKSVFDKDPSLTDVLQ